LSGNEDIRVHVLHGSDGVPVGEYPMSSKRFAFRLSANGALLARQLTDARIEICQIAGTSTSLGRTQVGGFGEHLPFVLGKDRILVLSGRHAFLLNWSSGTLESTYYSSDGVPEVKNGVRATANALPAACKYDTRRWRLGASNTLIAASDRYGQLAVFDQSQRLICMFAAFRTRVNGWMPDGTRFVHAITADAATLHHFANALQMAASRG
jgi:hypothetical protein